MQWEVGAIDWLWYGFNYAYVRVLLEVGRDGDTKCCIYPCIVGHAYLRGLCEDKTMVGGYDVDDYRLRECQAVGDNICG